MLMHAYVYETVFFLFFFLSNFKYLHLKVMASNNVNGFSYSAVQHTVN